MPRNKLLDLNDHLFAQIEKLGEADLSGENLKAEIERAKAMSTLAAGVIEIAKVSVDAMRLISNGKIGKEDLPLMLNTVK